MPELQLSFGAIVRQVPNRSTLGSIPGASKFLTVKNEKTFVNRLWPNPPSCPCTIPQKRLSILSAPKHVLVSQSKMSNTSATFLVLVDTPPSSPAEVNSVECSESIGGHYNPTDDWMVWTNRDYDDHTLRGWIRMMRRCRSSERQSYFGY